VTNPRLRPNDALYLTVGDHAVPDPGVRELIAAREIVQAFLTAPRPEDVFQFTLDRVTPLVGASFSCIYLLDEGSDLMRLAAVHNWPARYASFLGEMRVRVGAGPSGEAASEKRAIEIGDVFSDSSLEDWQEVARELGFRALVALPLQTAQGVLGTITFYFTAPGPFSAESRSLLRMVADQAAATAEKARLIGDLQRANVALEEKNRELERQNAMLLDARRAKDEFLANISHELRTPLTAVIGYSSLMQEGIAGPLTAEQQRTLAQVKGSGEKLLELVDDLLELTTLAQGSAELELATFDCRDAATAAAGRARGTPVGVTLRMQLPAEPITICSDRRRVEKVLAILLENAFKFTTEGQVSIGIARSGRGVVLSVEDSGIGIPPAAMEYIFEEFRQVDGSSTRRFGGSGLGLALARRLARTLGGEISVESTIGAGSRFALEVPDFPGKGSSLPE
jgi:signal transduction histidine kinase